jgi:hypothetical protein
VSSKIVLRDGYRGVCVWNDLARREVLQSYPAYVPEQIEVVGIPQFDAYAEKPSLSYANWCDRYGLDPAKRTLLFSTAPRVRHEQQARIVETLLEAIVEGDRLPGDIQVLVKCHPFDDPTAYDHLTARYPVAVQGQRSGPHAADTWNPQPEEIATARDALYYCSANLNIFSTVTIEAAYFDKPIVHIAYDPVPPVGRIPCREYYNWDHFRPVVATGAATLVESADAMIDAVRAALSAPQARAPQRAALVAQYIGQPVGSAREALTAAVVRMCLPQAAVRAARREPLCTVSSQS